MLPSVKLRAIQRDNLAVNRIQILSQSWTFFKRVRPKERGQQHRRRHLPMFESIAPGLFRNTLMWKMGPLDIPVATFLVKDELVANGWILVDAGFDSHVQELVQDIKEKIADGVLTHILITHGHLDHVAALPALLELYPSCRVRAHENEATFITDGTSYSQVNGDHFVFQITKYLAQNTAVRVPKDRLDPVKESERIGNVIECVETHGHTPGSMSYLHIASKSFMTGDAVMFYNAFNKKCPQCQMLRFSTGFWQKAKQSIHKMIQMDINRYYPAHDQADGVTKEQLEAFYQTL